MKRQKQAYKQDICFYGPEWKGKCKTVCSAYVTFLMNFGEKEWQPGVRIQSGKGTTWVSQKQGIDIGILFDVGRWCAFPPHVKDGSVTESV